MKYLIAFSLVVMAVAGCGPAEVKKVTVSGTVTYKGQKLTGGILKFIGPGSAYSANVIQADGTYIMTDIIPGEVKVAYTPSPSGSGSSDGSVANGPAPKEVDVPAKFMDPETSGVTYTITPDMKTLDIEFK